MLVKVFACGEKPIWSPLSVRTNATALNLGQKNELDHVRTWHSSTGDIVRRVANCSTAGDPSASAP
jgi:hypothetical protein